MEHKKIGIFITGGIAAYKIPLLVRELIKRGHEVRVAMTPSAKEFVTPQTLSVLTKSEVLTDDNQFSNPKHVSHISLAKWMDLAVIVPATANTIAKLANGLADNVLTTTLLAFPGPKLVVPAMNDQMWLNEITQANISKLKQYHYGILPPATGFLAEGYKSVGRMPDIDIITTFIETFHQEQFLLGKTILISAGGTKEALDPVRFLTNRSSGKMGYALANQAAALGAKVTLVTTKDLPILPNINLIKVENAQEMQTQMQTNFATNDITVMAAAVSDFRPKNQSTTKIKKQPGTKDIQLELTTNPDILKTLGEAKTKQFLVGFAAETNDLIANATKKLQSKNLDLIIANQVGSKVGFESDDNSVTILSKSHDPIEFPLTSKLELAFKIWETINQLNN